MVQIWGWESRSPFSNRSGTSCGRIAEYGSAPYDIISQTVTPRDREGFYWISSSKVQYFTVPFNLATLTVTPYITLVCVSAEQDAFKSHPLNWRLGFTNIRKKCQRQSRDYRFGNWLEYRSSTYTLHTLNVVKRSLFCSPRLCLFNQKLAIL